MVRDLLVSCSLQLKWSNIVKWAHRFLSFFPMVDHVCLLFLSCSLVPFSWPNHRQTQVATPLSCDLSLDSNLITPVLPLRPNEYVPTFKSFGTISSPVRCHYTIVLMFKVIFLHHHLSIYPTFLWWWCMVTIVGRHSNTLLIPFLELLYDTNCLSFTSFNTQPFGLSLVVVLVRHRLARWLSLKLRQPVNLKTSSLSLYLTYDDDDDGPLVGWLDTATKSSFVYWLEPDCLFDISANVWKIMLRGITILVRSMSMLKYYVCWWSPLSFSWIGLICCCWWWRF